MFEKLNWYYKFKKLIIFDSYGAIATASFLICIISGIILAVPYNVNNPYASITLILITNPSASFFRNIHYWSAQFFLVFTILHLWEHLKAGTEKNQSHAVWLRLSIAAPVVFFVMITGFILKADADSLQAWNIISALTQTIPLAGKTLSYGLFGQKGDFQITYVHHIATATLFLTIIIWEHARTLWARLPTFLITLTLLALISIFLNAPINNLIHHVMKGPWYFVGLQELLHWVSHPGWVMFFIFLIILAVYLLFHIPEIPNKLIKKTLLYLFFIYLFFSMIGYFFRGENWRWQVPWNHQFASVDPFRIGWDLSASDFSKYSDKEVPTINGRREACMMCHNNVSGLSPSHDPQAIGCASCHLGDPFTLDKNRAHRNMALIPGNLANAKQTCGTTNCHPDIISRINLSLMSSNSGIVSVDRFVFGETNSPDILSHINEIGFTPAHKHLRNLCSNCHLGNEKTSAGPIDEQSRGGGCNACHLNYSEQAKELHAAYLAGKKDKSLLPKIHPALGLNISNNHCFGCHSRSGRISTNYEGWHETMLNEEDIKDSSGFRVLQDKRVFQFIVSDIHHEKGMECIDCHNSYDVMGDGKSYSHEEDAAKIKCEDCHTNVAQRVYSYDELDLETKKIFDIRKFEHKDQKIIAGSSGQPMVNVFIDNGEIKMVGKNSKKIHPIKPPAKICSMKKVHENLSCSSCHTAWAPHCIGCHNSFDGQAEGYDLLRNKPVLGTWVEYTGKFMAVPPTLGVRMENDHKIEPCVPGMILSIDKSGLTEFVENSSPVFQRLYAPVAPHTTSAKGRGCKTCHNDPLAIGYGKGVLVYKVQKDKGRWTFQPEFAPNKYDKLPEDAWIGFLSEPDKTASTRINFRPFTIEEQKRILLVGACLTCHDEKSKTMLNSLENNFSEYLTKLTSRCILPLWN